MKNEDFKKVTDELQEKVGKEKASLIADNIATIISDNMQTNKLIADKDKEIQKLKQEKENLMQTNMNLLQQIPMGEDPTPKAKEKEQEKPKASAFDFREVFDENGNFKK